MDVFQVHEVQYVHSIQKLNEVFVYAGTLRANLQDLDVSMSKIYTQNVG